ncbi:regulator [Belliella sp. DSM 107340]|uniref:Regulator n=1 Tax=Belliella calami TaxID=2923436 RepID=A0ABS9UR86_9BACT|nr:triple tyrosine motif-containing protein [Belliella calami]MCH7399122.1 regulator [Belliella calami]
MKKYPVCLVLLLFGINGFAQNLGLPFSKYYSSQDYQGGIQNYAIAQNNAGIIYVANNYGLLEHDGTTWRRHAIPNGAKTRHVQLDQKGVVYISGQGDFGYFSVDDFGQFVFNSLKSELPEKDRNLEEVWKVFISNTEIYFCTFEKIFVFDEERRFKYSIESKTNFESFHFSNNQLYINEFGAGLKKLQDGKFIDLMNSDFFGDKLVTGIIKESTEKYLIFTRDEGVFPITTNGILDNSWNESKNWKINTSLMLRNGQIAIGTQLNGLMIFDSNGKKIMQLDKNNGLDNNSIISLFEDLSGNLWIGHNNGLTMVQLGLPFRRINQHSGLTGTGYHGTFEKGKIYYGTNNGVYFQEELNNNWSDINLVQNSTGQVYQIKSIQGDLLVAHNDGVFVIKDNEAVRIEGPSGIWNFQLLKNHPDLILVGSYSGLHLYQKTLQGIKYLRQINGFNGSSRVIEQDEKGNIWVAHGYKGVYRLKLDEAVQNAEVEFFGAESGLFTTNLNNVWKINNRLVFTTQAGIFRFVENEKKFERDDFFKNYFEDDFLIHYLVEDQIGNIYFIGETEIGVLEKNVDGSYTKTYQIFNQLLPLLNDDLQNISAFRGNEILFGANGGFVHFNLNENNIHSTNFPTLIRAVYLTGPSDSLLFHGNSYSENKLNLHQSRNSIPKIPYKKGNIRFESTNPTPNNEKDLRFQYWLEGLENDYGEWVDKREKAYTNLREGNYTFHVRSKNLFDEISPVASYSFVILPPWYRSTIAYFLYTVMVIAGIYLSYRTIEKRYQKKAQKLKTASRRVIEEKDSELKITQEEVEKLRTEKLKHEIQIKDKELATATMHLITKNGFIDHMRSNLNSIIKKSRNQEVKNELQKVIKNIEKNIAEDHDWEQFEIHFDQVHGDFMSRFKKEFNTLSPQEIKLSAYLRMNLSTKEIAYLMNISIRGVEIARYRLRKKLNLDRSENLQEYILKF